MNEGKRMLTEVDVKLREYGLLKHILCSDHENEEDEKWRIILKSILSDENYLKQAIKLEEDDFGMISLIGMVTPSLMLSNSQMVDPNIIEELLHNILYSYADKEKKQPLMHITDFGGLSYLSLILMNHEIKLSDEFQQIIKPEVAKVCRGKFNYDIVSYFLMNSSIDIKYKKEIIGKISDENLWQLQERWENALMGSLYDMMKDMNFVEVLDAELKEDEEDEEDVFSTSFDEVLRIIEERLEG